MVTITVPVDTLIHTDKHPYCSDPTCPCQGEDHVEDRPPTEAELDRQAFDLSGYEFAPRTIRHRHAGQDIRIVEQPYKYGLRLSLRGLALPPVQLRELKRALMLWKYGVREVPRREVSPFAQAFGLREFEML